MDLKNLTPFAAKHLVVSDIDGGESLLVVVKATYDVSGDPKPAEEQTPIAFADEYHGEPGESSVKVATDLTLSKPAVDVIVAGSAYTTARNREHVDARFKVGSLEKWVRVFGDRFWHMKNGFLSVSGPESFERMPLTWERAFGGTDPTPEGEGAWEPRNPVGVGFRSDDSELPIDATPLPNVESPYEAFQDPNERPTPWGVASIAPNWHPRASFVGTYDDQWREQRAPLLPRDFDSRFYHAAPPDQILTEDPPHGVPVEMQQMSAAGWLSFALPNPALEAVVKTDEAREVLPLQRDTIVLDGDAEQVRMVWRASLPVDGRVYSIQWVKVDYAAGADA